MFGFNKCLKYFQCLQWTAKYLLEFDIQDITGFQGYDGQTAWSTAPWTGNPKPQVMPDDRDRNLRSRADFDGLLYNWKEKGHSVELVGRDTVENVQAFKLKVAKKDGGVLLPGCCKIHHSEKTVLTHGEGKGSCR